MGVGRARVDLAAGGEIGDESAFAKGSSTIGVGEEPREIFGIRILDEQRRRGGAVEQDVRSLPGRAGNEAHEAPGTGCVLKRGAAVVASAHEHDLHSLVGCGAHGPQDYREVDV